MGFGKKLAKQWKNAAVISVYQGLGGKTVPRKYNRGGTPVAIAAAEKERKCLNVKI